MRLRHAMDRVSDRSGRLRATAAVAALAAACALGACGSGGDAAVATFKPLPPETSWISGQPSLLGLAAYASIADRASALGDLRHAAYELELQRIQAAREAAARRAREEALRRYRELRRKALERYRAALRRAARLRELQRRKLAALREKRRRELAALRKKLQVKPGEECKVPEVAARYDCRTGMTPLKKPLPRR